MKPPFNTGKYTVLWLTSTGCRVRAADRARCLEGAWEQPAVRPALAARGRCGEWPCAAGSGDYTYYSLICFNTSTYSINSWPKLVGSRLCCLATGYLICLWSIRLGRDVGLVDHAAYTVLVPNVRHPLLVRALCPSGVEVRHIGDFERLFVFSVHLSTRIRELDEQQTILMILSVF